MCDTLEDVAVTLKKCREFIDADFLMGAETGSVMRPPCHAALASWTKYYRSIIKVTDQFVQCLLPLEVGTLV